MAELLYLNTAEGLHNHDGAGVYCSDSLDQRNLVAGESEGQTVGLFSGGVLVGADKYYSHVRLAGQLDSSLVNRSVLGSLVHQINCLRTVVAKLEGIGLHRHAGAVYTAYAGS